MQTTTAALTGNATATVNALTLLSAPAAFFQLENTGDTELQFTITVSGTTSAPIWLPATTKITLRWLVDNVQITAPATGGKFKAILA